MQAECFHNARVLREDGRLEPGELWVVGARVVTREFAKRQGCSVRRHDCRNKIIAPGFVDIQVNGAYGVDFTATKDMAQALHKLNVLITQTGCTSYCPTIITSSPAEYHKRVPQIAVTDGSAATGANVLGIHTEGPFISMQKRGCHPVDLVSTIPECATQEDARKVLDDMYGPDRSNIVLLTLAPEQPGAMKVIKQLAEEGIAVSLGHSTSTHDTGFRGLEHGASCLTHLFSAMNAFGHREPSLPGLIASDVNIGPHAYKLKALFEKRRQVEDDDSDLSSDPTCASCETCDGAPILHYGLIADCVHTHEYSLRLAYGLNKDGLCLITDAMAALGLPDGDYKLGETEVVVGGSPRRALQKGTNTLAGVIAPINECIRLFTHVTGCGLGYALRAASYHPSRALGIEKWKGHLSPGADADFVIIDDDVNVHQTWVMGEQVYDNENGFLAAKVDA